MFEWLKLFRREHELPENPRAAVRVDFVGTVVSPNLLSSPVSDFASSLIEVVLYDHEIRNDADLFMGTDNTQRERFIPLGGVRLGALVVEDDSGRKLHIDEATPVTIVPLSGRPIPLDSPLRMPELAAIARKSKHMLMVRETRFRETDAVRVRATVEMRQRVVAGGYRDAIERILVPVRGEPLVLREML